MKFKHSLKCKSNIKKKKVYEFNIDKKDINKAKKATFKKQHFFRDGLQVYGIYTDKNEIHLIMYHSFDSFIEISQD